MLMELQASGARLSNGTGDQDWALRLYRRAKFEGGLRRLLARIMGRSTALRSLCRTVMSRSAVQVQVVAISEIVGSEDRARDFDNAFAPAQEHSRARWLSVAIARRRNIGLPPVRLIRGNDGYYVRDGHHRISVARALGEEYIEAEIG